MPTGTGLLPQQPPPHFEVRTLTRLQRTPVPLAALQQSPASRASVAEAVLQGIALPQRHSEAVVQAVLLPLRRGVGAMESSMAKGSVPARLFLTRRPHPDDPANPNHAHIATCRRRPSRCRVQAAPAKFERSRARRHTRLVSGICKLIRPDSLRSALFGRTGTGCCLSSMHTRAATHSHTHTHRQTDRQTAGCQSHPTRAPWLRSAKRSPHRPEHVEKDAAVISRPVLRYCVPSDLVQFVRGFADNESGASRWPTSATSVIVAATRRVLTRIT